MGIRPSCVRRLGVVGLGAIMFMTSLRAGDQRTLAELYRTGKVRLVPERIIDMGSLPKDVLFVGLTDISVDSKGQVYVLDAIDNNIKKFDAMGQLLKIIGRKGQGPGEFNLPYRMAVAGDRLVICDLANRRLCILAADGLPLNTVPLSEPSERPEKIRGIPKGKFVFETERTYYDQMDKPQDRRISILGPDLQPEKEVYSGSVLRNIFLRRPPHTMMNVPQPFGPDIHWDASPDGQIVIGFSERYEAGIFDGAGGKTGAIARIWDSVKVTNGDKTQWFEGMGQMSDQGAKMGAPDYIVKATKFPSFKPAFDEILWDPEGNILVHPILEKGQAGYYDAFTSKGDFIARFELIGSPQSFHSQPKIVSGGFIWSCDNDEEGNYRVVKWRLSST